ncbi:MAG: sigma factor-like helix-turn-helix DNA-binding protein [bacterium]|nr:sigma factor-like helix-turn-helix DNA-binding protein [bacterium]
MIILFDYYGSLLTDKQRTYFNYYYFDNLSLGEISENLNISRSAVYNCIVKLSSKLMYYEDVLGMYKKDVKLRSIVNKLNSKDQIAFKDIVI